MHYEEREVKVDCGRTQSISLLSQSDFLTSISHRNSQNYKTALYSSVL